MLVHSFPSLFWNIVFRHASLSSSQKSTIYSPILYGMLCKLNLLFLSLPVWAFMASPMIKTSCLGMCQTRKALIVNGDVHFITHNGGTITRDECWAGVAIKWSTHHSQLNFPYTSDDFKAWKPISPMTAMTEIFHADAETNEMLSNSGKWFTVFEVLMLNVGVLTILLHLIYFGLGRQIYMHTHTHIYLFM